MVLAICPTQHDFPFFAFPTIESFRQKKTTRKRRRANDGSPNKSIASYRADRLRNKSRRNTLQVPRIGKPLERGWAKSWNEDFFDTYRTEMYITVCIVLPLSSKSLYLNKFVPLQNQIPRFEVESIAGQPWLIVRISIQIQSRFVKIFNSIHSIVV